MSIVGEHEKSLREEVAADLIPAVIFCPIKGGVGAMQGILERFLLFSDDCAATDAEAVSLQDSVKVQKVESLSDPLGDFQDEKGGVIDDEDGELFATQAHLNILRPGLLDENGVELRFILQERLLTGQILFLWDLHLAA